jgi:hypothetical protein
MGKKPPELIEGSYRAEDRPVTNQPIFNNWRIWVLPVGAAILLRLLWVLAARAHAP